DQLPRRTLMALTIRIGIFGGAAHRLTPSAPYGGMMRSLVTRTFTLNPGRTLIVGWMPRARFVICWPAWLMAPAAFAAMPWPMVGTYPLTFPWGTTTPAASTLPSATPVST